MSVKKDVYIRSDVLGLEVRKPEAKTEAGEEGGHESAVGDDLHLSETVLVGRVHLGRLSGSSSSVLLIFFSKFRVELKVLRIIICNSVVAGYVGQ